jgi:hypothetical protein
MTALDLFPEFSIVNNQALLANPMGRRIPQVRHREPRPVFLLHVVAVHANLPTVALQANTLIGDPVTMPAIVAVAKVPGGD